MPVKKKIAKVVKKQAKLELPSLTELLEAGAHFGHSVKRRNPRMDGYVYAVKDGVQVIDLVKTRECLEAATNYLMEQAATGDVLVLGTKGQAVEIVRSEAVRIGTPFIVNRWVGGLFTNWNEVKKRIDKLLDMQRKTEAGEYKKYTKKEQVLLAREIERLERMFGGVAKMQGLPKAIFIVDPLREVTAVREAIARGIPIVAVADTNSNPQGIAHIIPANDDSLKTVEILVKAVLAGIEAGIKRRPKAEQK